MGVLLKWSDVVKKRIRAPSLLLVLAFLVGLAMVAVPPLMELMAYRTDENEYTAIAEQFRPPGTSIPAPMPGVQEPCTVEAAQSVVPTPWVTEDVLTASENDMGTSQTTAQPTGESDDFLKSVETPSPEAGITGEVIQLKVDEAFTLPQEMRKLVNYTVIQTGVNMAVTSVMWAGIALMVISGTVGLIRKRRAAKRNIH